MRYDAKGRRADLSNIKSVNIANFLLHLSKCTSDQGSKQPGAIRDAAEHITVSGVRTEPDVTVRVCRVCSYCRVVQVLMM